MSQEHRHEEQVETITIDDKVYNVKDLPHEIQAQLKLYDTWNKESHEQRVALSKTELAMQSLSNTMIESIRKIESNHSGEKEAGIQEEQ